LIGTVNYVVAQQLTCEFNVPLTATSSNMEAVRNLRLADLTAEYGLAKLRIGHSQAIMVSRPPEGEAEPAPTLTFPITSFKSDTGPRRIVFVLDTDRELASDARKAEGKVVEHILESARPGDSFALITARGPTRQVSFGQGPDAIKQAVVEIEGGAKGEGSNLGMLDAVMEASEWLGDSQLGDAIFLIARDLKDKHQTSYTQVFEAVRKRYIRIFAISLGPIASRTVNTKDYYYNLEKNIREKEPDYYLDMYSLAFITGGSSVAGGLKSPPKTFTLTDKHLKILQAKALQYYGLITDIYEIKLSTPNFGYGAPWHLTLTEAAQQRWPDAQLLYPFYLSTPCSH
jgi:hypothetical protein